MEKPTRGKQNIHALSQELLLGRGVFGDLLEFLPPQKRVKPRHPAEQSTENTSAKATRRNVPKSSRGLAWKTFEKPEKPRKTYKKTLTKHGRNKGKQQNSVKAKNFLCNCLVPKARWRICFCPRRRSDSSCATVRRGGLVGFEVFGLISVAGLKRSKACFDAKDLMFLKNRNQKREGQRGAR